MVAPWPVISKCKCTLFHNWLPVVWFWDSGWWCVLIHFERCAHMLLDWWRGMLAVLAKCCALCDMMDLLDYFIYLMWVLNQPPPICDLSSFCGVCCLTWEIASAFGWVSVGPGQLSGGWHPRSWFCLLLYNVVGWVLLQGICLNLGLGCLHEISHH